MLLEIMYPYGQGLDGNTEKGKKKNLFCEFFSLVFDFGCYIYKMNIFLKIKRKENK